MTGQGLLTVHTRVVVEHDPGPDFVCRWLFVKDCQMKIKAATHMLAQVCLS